MKRMICLILAMCFLFSGCGFFGERIREPVTFHYLCTNYPEDLCCVINTEQREASGHSTDLAYLLALYQMGPAAETLRSPLPAGTQIRVEKQDGQLLLELSEAAQALSDVEYTLACACLTLTCLDIIPTEAVTVSCGDRSKTMTGNSLILYDEIEIISPTEETQ